MQAIWFRWKFDVYISICAESSLSWKLQPSILQILLSWIKVILTSCFQLVLVTAHVTHSLMSPNESESNLSWFLTGLFSYICYLSQFVSAVLMSLWFLLCVHVCLLYPQWSTVFSFFSLINKYLYLWTRIMCVCMHRWPFCDCSCVAGSCAVGWAAVVAGWYLVHALPTCAGQAINLVFLSYCSIATSP